MRFLVSGEQQPNPSNEILDVLVRQRQVLQDLTSLTAQVRDALICCDVATLEGLAGRQETLIRYLAELDGSRQELMKQWLEQEKREPTVEEVEREKDAEIRLLAACEDVRDQIQALRSSNAVNHQLLAGITRWMNELLDGLADLFEQATPYDRHGLRPVPVESNLLVDRQV